MKYLLLTAIFVAIGWIERDYLKKHTRKGKTKLAVYSIMSISYAYNLLIIAADGRLATIDSVLIFWLAPIQKLLTGS